MGLRIVQFAVFALCLTISVPVVRADGLRISRAPASDWVSAGPARARLIAAPLATGGAQSVRLGVHIELDRGWKTYWRNPGDSGFPPTFDWHGSENLADTNVKWPAPMRFDLPGDTSFGYKDGVVFPVDIALVDPGAPLIARLQLVYGVCEDVCVPAYADLELTVPVGPDDEGPFADLVAQHAGRVPTDNPHPSGLAIERLTVTGTTTSERLMVEVIHPVGLSRPELIVEGGQDVYFAVPKLEMRSGTQAVITVPIDRMADAPPMAGQELTLTLVDGDNALQARVVVQAE